VNFQKITDGRCVQMLHIGIYDSEPVSYSVMESIAEAEGLQRMAKDHREIYLLDFRKMAHEKLKSVLRFKVI